MTTEFKVWRAWTGVTVTGCLMTVAYSGLTLFYDTVLETTGCSSAQFGLIYSAMGIGLMIGSLLAGRVLMINMKRFSMLGALCAFTLYGSISISKSITLIIICGFLYGMLFQLCGNILLGILASRWFNKGRPNLLSISFSAMSLALALTLPFVAKAISALGGKIVAFCIGVIITGISLVMTSFVVDGLPEDYGITAIDLNSVSGDEEIEAVFESSMPLYKCIFTVPFALLAGSVFLLATGSGIYFTNSIMIYQSFGISYVDAALGTSICGAAGMLTNLIGGLLVNRIGPRKGIAVYALLGAIVCLSVPALKGWRGAIIFAVFINCCAIFNLVGPMALPVLFGVKKGSMLINWLVGVSCVSSIIVGPWATWLYGLTNSYSIPMVIAGFGLLLAAGMIYVVFGKNMMLSIKRVDSEYRRQHID